MPIRAHISTKEKHYFEGWYIKIATKEHTFAFIPGISITDGKKEAFLQVILDQKSYYIPYSATKWRQNKQEFQLQIGENYFSKKGCRLNIHTEELTLHGVIRFGKLNPLSYSIMGPLEYVPFLGCKHEVISMDHALYGTLNVDNRDISFHNGRGYIESDRGHSFPESYYWSQCNHMKRAFTSVMVAAADVSVLNKSFLGCTAAILYKGKEYRFATYTGAKIDLYTKNRIILRQKNMLLKVTLLQPNPVTLSAPINGSMIRRIEEQVNCKVHYYFTVSGRVFLDEVCDTACLESSFMTKVFE